MPYEVFLVCAVVGGVVFTIQLVMQLIGLDHDMDVDADVDIDVDADADHGDSSLFFGFLSFRTIVAFFLFFGLGGIGARESQFESLTATLIAFGSGLAAMVVVGLIMSGLRKLQASGSLDIREAIGQPGDVYLKIPGNNEGNGKVTITVQSRSIQLQATTPNEELPTGAKIIVTRVVTADTVEVVAANAAAQA